MAGLSWSVRRCAGTFLAVAIGVSACARRESAPELPRGPSAKAAAETLEGYAALAFTEYSDAVILASKLRDASDALVEKPSEETLRAAREAWKAARIPYTQTETFRFYGGPIDRVETFVNTWPVDERFIEAEDGKSGIVNDVAKYPVIDEALLTRLNMKEGETNVTTGFHAVEFLLWGADTDPNGPGKRPASDFAGTEGPPARRAAYLRAVTRLLVGHLEGVQAEWKENVPGNYRAWFLGLPRKEALGLSLKGMGSLSAGELAGERLTVPYQTKDQENEHSCFSDNTRDDLAGDVQGLSDVCTGTYTRPNGERVTAPGLCALVSSVDGPLGKQLASEMAASVAALRAVPQPFDQAIAGHDDAPGRVAVHAALVALEAQARTLNAVARALGATLPPTVVLGK